MSAASQTPLCDFLAEYAGRNGARFHMPGHKGKQLEGAAWDITEIRGADVLYRAEGILLQSQARAAAHFGAGRTVYSAEGSSLCIRAMLYLATLRARAEGIRPVLLAGRNAHRTLMTAAALLDAEIEWLAELPGESLLSGRIDPQDLEKRLRRRRYMGVWLTTPDYPGHLEDLRPLSALCRRCGTPLLVDNAHGAYLKFLPEDRHPMTLGADLCCDSAHKTLCCLTGAAYLHVSAAAPAVFSARAEDAMALFASTSPSWLILSSLDRMNGLLAGDYPKRLRETAERVARIRRRLEQAGWSLIGEEPLKLSLAAKAYGYTGDEVHEILRRANMECEFSDPDLLTVMISPDNSREELDRLEEQLLAIPRRAPIRERPPVPDQPERVCSIREAMLGPRREVRVEEALGEVLADATVSCPPAIPIGIAGERIDEAALACFRYYGIEKVGIAARR